MTQTFHKERMRELVDGIDFCSYQMKLIDRLSFFQKLKLSTQYSLLNKKRNDLINELNFWQAVKDFKSNDTQQADK